MSTWHLVAVFVTNHNSIEQPSKPVRLMRGIYKCEVATQLEGLNLIRMGEYNTPRLCTIAGTVYSNSGGYILFY